MLLLWALQVAFLTSFAAFPWVVKPFYGFLSDTVPIFGYRRRSYLIICGLLGAPPEPQPCTQPGCVKLPFTCGAR